MPVAQDAVDEYGAYDPAIVRPASDEPPVSDDASGTSDSLAVADGPDAGETEEESVQFSPKVQEAFEGLLYLGALTRTFEWAGHRFTIRSLTVDEMLSVGQVTQPYANSMGEPRAYSTAMVAACLVTVDGEPLKLPLGPSRGAAALQARFEQVGQWFPHTIDYIFERYLELESKVEEVVKQMGEASG